MHRIDTSPAVDGFLIKNNLAYKYFPSWLNEWSDFPSGYFILADDVAKSDCLTQLHPKVQVDNQCVENDYER
ncbi:unnamed protein product [Aspergillus oryzae]|nr:unnamed protein product [Aspergillus oryzae]GMF91956.1 unnamed protein product [Aspergillus oryzae]